MPSLPTLTGQRTALRNLVAIRPPSLARVALKSALRSLSIQPRSCSALRQQIQRQQIQRQPLYRSRLLACLMAARLRPAQRQPLRPAQRQPLRLLIWAQRSR
jgi:hypothetical protein